MPHGHLNLTREPGENPASLARLRVEYWPIERLKPYERNPRRNDNAVDQIRASIREFGFAVPILAKSDGEVIDGHLRLKGAIAERMGEVPVVPCDGWTDAQVKAFRLMVNRSVSCPSPHRPVFVRLPPASTQSDDLHSPTALLPIYFSISSEHRL